MISQPKETGDTPPPALPFKFKPMMHIDFDGDDMNLGRRGKKTKGVTNPARERNGNHICNVCEKSTPRNGSCFHCLTKSMYHH